jgi:Fe-S-cluster-containing hydrogenase component 2
LPDTCIDCGVCEPECPVTAIFTADDTPDKWRSFIEKNADYYTLAGDEFQSKWGSAGKE